MFLSELCKIVNAYPPLTGAGAKESVYVDMSEYTHLTAIIQNGIGGTSTITVQKSATGVNLAAGTAIVFNYRLCNVAHNAAGGDILGTLIAAPTNAGVAVASTDCAFVVIELNAIELGIGYPYVKVCTDATQDAIAMTFILSGARYQEPGTALTV